MKQRFKIMFKDIDWEDYLEETKDGVQTGVKIFDTKREADQYLSTLDSREFERKVCLITTISKEAIEHIFGFFDAYTNGTIESPEEYLEDYEVEQ